MRKGTSHWQPIKTWHPTSLLPLHFSFVSPVLALKTPIQSHCGLSPNLLFPIKISKNVKRIILKLIPKCYHFTTVRQKKKERNLRGLHSSELLFLTSCAITEAVFFFPFFVFRRIFSMSMKHSFKARKQILKVFLLHATSLSK